MFICLYRYYSGSGSIITSHRDRGGGGETTVSLSPSPRKKETKDYVASFSFVSSRVANPLVHSYSPFLLLLSLRIQIHSYLSSRGEEEVRAPPPPSPKRRRRRSARRPSPSCPRRHHHRCSRRRLPCSPPTPPATPIHPLRAQRCVLLRCPTS